MRFLAALFALALLLPAAALGKAKTKTIAPPGNSGIQQYVETVPTSHGGRPTSTIHGGGGTGPSSGSGTSGGNPGAGGAIPAATSRALTSSGSEGATAAAVLAASASAGAGKSAGAGRASSTGQPTGPSVDQLGSSSPAPATAVIKALTGTSSSGGLGTWLPIILGACVVALGAVVLLRRRRAT